MAAPDLLQLLVESSANAMLYFSTTVSSTQLAAVFEGELQDQILVSGILNASRAAPWTWADG